MPVFVIILIALSFLPFKADAQQSFFSQEEELSFFNYTSNRCRNMQGPEEPYRIAMQLRDSKDEKEKLDAAECLLTAASWGGSGPAQFELARMYSTGTIFPQSNVFAYRWAQLAVIGGNNDAASLRDRLEKELSSPELEDAFLGVKKILEERKKAKEGKKSNSQNGQGEGQQMNEGEPQATYGEQPNYEEAPAYEPPPFE